MVNRIDIEWKPDRKQYLVIRHSSHEPDWETHTQIGQIHEVDNHFVYVDRNLTLKAIRHTVEEIKVLFSRIYDCEVTFCGK